MTAIFSSKGMPLGLSMGGIQRVSAFRSCSATNFFRSSMATGASTAPRMQAASQGLLQMRPQMAGKGLSFLMSCRASR